MDNDQSYADCIRLKLKALREAIQNAEATGLSVAVPELTYLYLQNGTASGSEIDWKIERHY